MTLRNVYWTPRYGPGENTFNLDNVLYPYDWPFWADTPPPLVNGVVPVMPGYIDTHLGRETIRWCIRGTTDASTTNSGSTHFRRSRS